MSSKAWEAFDQNAEDIDRLLEIHEAIGGPGSGRRFGLEVLNKSAIVLITAFWESYCEDIASESLQHIVDYANSSDDLPKELEKRVASEISKMKHELAVWKLADDSWREYLRDRLGDIREARNRNFNTPKTSNVDDMFLSSIGVKKLSTHWRWERMGVAAASSKLDHFVELRGDIAHRGKHSQSVTKKQVEDYLNHVSRLAQETDRCVNGHVKQITGKPLW